MYDIQKRVEYNDNGKGGNGKLEGKVRRGKEGKMCPRTYTMWVPSLPTYHPTRLHRPGTRIKIAEPFYKY